MQVNSHQQINEKLSGVVTKQDLRFSRR
jgi:hypothetical protein